MYEFLKVLIIIGILLILSYPILPFHSKAKRFSTFRALRYDTPHNKKNLPFVFLTIFEFVALAVLFEFLMAVVGFVGGLPFVDDVLDFIGSRIKFDVLIFVSVLVINFIILYAFVFLKGFLKGLVFDRIWGLAAPKKSRREKRKEKKETEEKKKSETETPESDDEQSPEFLHSEEEENPDLVPERDEDSWRYRLYGALCKPFFKGEGYRYARSWVVRVVSVAQTFIYIVEIAYFLLFATFLFAAFFAMPNFVYDILLKVVPNIFLYPFVSLIFLQEICNTLRCEMETVTVEVEDAVVEEQKKIEKKKLALKRLHAKLVRKYTDAHKLRYYEVKTAKNMPEYKATNVIYERALKYVRKTMENASGHVVESYMRGVDALLNDNNVYFGASFYSELGEYLTAYTYIRLLAGERMVFVVSSREEAENLKKFVGRRLNQLAGFKDESSFRIRDGSERLDQADVLIATPDDFSKDNIVENNPTFFENVCNAVFIEADKILNLDGYLCTIIANRLRNATGREVCFVFLTTHICQGLVKSIKKFFKTTKDIVECNNADENEDVTFMLWNCETDGIYERNGQRVETPEMLIATAAYEADVDGIRIITSSPMSMEKMVALRNHRVEINEMKKEVPEVNYMICVDDNFNMASAIYAYTRFRGKQASMVHILSKPYLLREYFASRAKEYVNRSAFIKPRVAEHADEQKLLLLDLFCDATRNVEGMKLSEYTDRMKCIIKEYADDSLYQEYKKREFDHEELVGYMLEVLRGRTPRARSEAGWIGYKSCYRLTSNKEDRGYQLQETNYIAFLFVERVFEELLRCNRRVELWLNGHVIGHLDTFASRLFQQCVPGQSIVYRNCEYEIDRIFVPGEDSEEGESARLYLRQENVTFKNCLDTVFLRRYTLAGALEESESETSVAMKDFDGVMHYTRGVLERITVSMSAKKVLGETYGFYNLMSDTQTLDFTRTVQGNPHLHPDVVKTIQRDMAETPVLTVTLSSREECNDGMRRLLATVLNEYLRTMFPTVYRCVAVVPVLQEPYDPATSFADDHFNRDVAGLYPYLVGEKEEDAHRIRLLIINDCHEDVGVLDVLYDGAARIVEELFSYAYSYLKWLQEHPGSVGDQKHYIYFGGEALPAVYDLDKTVELLVNCARKFMRTDAGDRLVPEEEVEEVREKRCAFCHTLLEEGRYSSFGQNRYICISCEAEAVTDESELARAEKAAKRYLKNRYPQVNLPEDITFKQDGIYTLSPGAVLNEFYYKIDTDTRTVMVEKDDPATTVCVSVLHGLVFFWQYDRKCWNNENYRVSGYLTAQMYYEEFEYLKSHGHENAESWLREHIDAAIRENLEELEKYLAENEGKTSFDFIEEKMKENMVEDRSGDGEGDVLFDPDRVPRFWKRFLYLDPDAVADDDENENTGEDDDEEDIFGDTDGDESDETDDDTSAAGEEEEDSHLAPPPGLEDEEEDPTEGEDTEEGDESEGEDTEEAEDGEETPAQRRKREKAERKAQKEEEKRRKKEEQERIKRERREKKELEKLLRKRKKDGEDTVDPTPDGEEDTDELTGEDEADKKPTPKKPTPKKPTPAPVDDETDYTAADDTDGDEGEDGDEAKKPAKKQKKVKPKKKKPVVRGIKSGEEMIPFEEEENENPRLSLYNSIARAAFDFHQGDIELPRPMSIDEVRRIYHFVMYDYPEIFWIKDSFRYSYNPANKMVTSLTLSFRYEKADGTLDAALIKRYRKEIRESVGYFTKGITKKTSPYKALLTVYRRVVLAFDYDHEGLKRQKSGLGPGQNVEDELRSLHAALARHKVVCTGYAVAMQYLLQSVGICCGQVVSETHSWNVVKIGGHVYHLDATWGDHSGEQNKDKVFYDYFCITSGENRRDGAVRVPDPKLFAGLDNFTAQKYEYFRYHNAYLTRYDEATIARILADGILRKEPCIGFRCSSKTLYDTVYSRLQGGRMGALETQVRAIVAAKNKRLAKQVRLAKWVPNSNQYTVYFVECLK